MGQLLDSKRVFRRTRSRWGLLRAVPNPMERRTIRETRRRIGGVWVWPGAVRTWLVYPVVAIGVAFGMVVLLRVFGSVLAGWYGVAFFFAVMGMLLLSPIAALWWGARVNKKRNSSTWRALLWHGRCAVCSHPLERGFDVDGITNCSECGAHWALDRLRWGACPGCGYSLGGVPRNEAGIVTCPECGQGWWMSERAAGAERAREAGAGPEGAARIDP